MAFYMAQAQCLKIYLGSGFQHIRDFIYICKNKIYHRQWSWMKFPREPTQANKYPSLESTGNFLR